MPLHSYASCTFVCPLYVHTPPGVYTPHMSPILGASVCSHRLLHFVGGCKEPPYMLDTSFTPPPVWGCLPLGFHLPFICCLPCSSICFRNICMSYGDFPLMFVAWGGVPPSDGGFGSISTWDAHMLILVHSCSSLCLMFLLWLQLLLLQLQWCLLGCH